jgi:hypothetical protein
MKSKVAESEGEMTKGEGKGEMATVKGKGEMAKDRRTMDEKR